MMGGDETFSSLASKVNRHMLAADDSSAVVSIVFARPQSRLMHDVIKDFAYLDTATGPSWGLLFPGYEFNKSLYDYRQNLSRESDYSRIYGPSEPTLPQPSKSEGRRHKLRFNGSTFIDVARDLSDKHGSTMNYGPGTWRYSGNADIVSLMAYRTPLADDSIWHWYPEESWPDNLVKYRAFITYDYASLRSITLTDSNDQYTYLNLSEYVQAMADWRSDTPDVRELMPGEFVRSSGPDLALRDGLRFTAAAIGSGVIGNYAYDLIKWISK